MQKITANFEILMRQATKTQKQYLSDFENEKRPIVLAALINGANQDFTASVISIHLQKISDALQAIADRE